MTNLAPLIDHTLLAPTAGPFHIEQLCDEARRFGFASVCVNPRWVSLAARCLGDSPVAVCTVVGFPLGATTTETKIFETVKALGDGADEIDMVMDLGNFLASHDELVQHDMASVIVAAERRPVKVILETCLLSDAQIVRACGLAVDAGAAFVKTSTGFSTGGATVEVVSLMARTVKTAAGVKASGVIRTREQALAFVEAGATRIGTSSGPALCTDKGTDEKKGDS